MEAKFAAEMEEHKVRLDKEYDAVKQNFVAEMDKLRKRQVAEIDKKVICCAIFLSFFYFLVLLCSYSHKMLLRSCFWNMLLVNHWMYMY